MGLCRLPCTGCERVGERWRDGAGSLLTLGYRVISMHAPVLARAVDAADFRPSRHGDRTVPAAAHRVRACQGAWRDGAGSLLTLGYRVTKMLAHMLAWAVDAVDFRPSRNGDGTVPATVHRVRACQGAMAQRRG